MMHIRDMNRRFSPKRHKARFPTFISLDGDKHRVVIRNVSYDGMNIFVPFDLEPGTPLSVIVNNTELPAIVHWCKEGCAGVHLLERLDSDALRALEGSVKAS